MSKTPPDIYMDGCTLFPEKFGSVSHKDVCDKHDRAYWNDRTFILKLKADFIWFGGVTSTHFKQNNIFWMGVAFIMASGGLIGLLTWGTYLWNRRHRFD